MSTVIRSTFRITFILIPVLFVLACIPVVLFAADISVATAPTQEPTPWWQRVDEIQNLILKWIGALSVIVGALAVFSAFVLAKFLELRERLNRVDDRANAKLVVEHRDATAATATAAAVAAAVAASNTHPNVPQDVIVVNTPENAIPNKPV